MVEEQSIEDKSYTKASFFKCALQVNPVEYIQYRGEKQSLNEDEYNQQLLDACLEAGIQVVGLANHGSVSGLDSMRNLFSKNDIVVFPGFEISTSEKIHFVCLFDEGKTAVELDRILGNLGRLEPNDGVSPSDLTASQLIDQVNDIGGFIYAAHSTGDNGVLKLRMNHAWQNKGLLAAQIPGSIEDLKGVEGDFYRRAFLNKDPNYQRDREMAAINASDVATPNDVKSDRASCLIKMTKPCFASFKQAFLDSGSRVRLNSDKPENYSSAVERVRFIGGYLDGLDIALSDNLNTVIGGRGTGKSTLIECIRFALDIQPFGKSARSQHESIIKANLGSERGLVELRVRSAAMHGRRFKVSRKFGDQPMISDDEGKMSPYLTKDLLPGLELYGQNEIYEMTRDPVIRNQLVERFLEGGHTEFDSKIKTILELMRENREDLVKAIKQREELLGDVEQLPKLQDQAKQFQSLGLDEKLKIVPRLEKEKQLVTRSEEEIGSQKQAIRGLKESLPDITFLSDNTIESLPHKEILGRIRDCFEKLRNEMGRQLDLIQNLHSEANNDLKTLLAELNESISKEEKILEDAFKNIPSSQGKTGRQIGSEYQQILKLIEQIKPKRTAMEHRDSQITELYNRRKKLLLELSEATTLRSKALQSSVKKLNKKLKEKVRLSLSPEGNRQILLDFLTSCNLEGVGAKRLTWVSEGDFSAGNLASKIREGEGALQKTNWGITPGVAQSLSRLSISKIMELEEIILLDDMEIELNVNHGEGEPQFRKIDDLSTGQQCTAVLHLLLLENLDPLILDQPEDNLDNAFIADRIVAELRKAKLSRQFLFATHNANIPVFGDAEWIGVLSVQESKGGILPDQQGAIDLPAIQRLAADILEGGKNAFNQRREKYGFE